MPATLPRIGARLIRNRLTSARLTSVRLTGARVGALLLGLPALLALAGCGAGNEDNFAPQCPKPSIPRDSNDLHRYRGAGRDITDTILEGRILGISGDCKRDGGAIVSSSIIVSLELSRGPAASGRTADVSYFVAVTQGERVLDKQVFRLNPEFPPNTDRLRLRGDEIELRLPISEGKPASVYQVSVGFQLSAAELEDNRRRQQRR